MYHINNAIVFVVSRTGASNEVLDLVKDLKTYNNCEIIAITEKGSPLGKETDLKITISSKVVDRDEQISLQLLINSLLCSIEKH